MHRLTTTVRKKGSHPVPIILFPLLLNFAFARLRKIALWYCFRLLPAVVSAALFVLLLSASPARSSPPADAILDNTTQGRPGWSPVILSTSFTMFEPPPDMKMATRLVTKVDPCTKHPARP